MKQETVNGLKNAGAQIGLHGVLIPLIGTLVGFFVQKKLIEREQKKAQLQSPQSSSEFSADFDE